MMIFRAALVAAALCAASGAAAHAEEWRRLGRDGPVEVAVDVNSFSGPRTGRTTRSVLVPTAAGDPYAWLVVDAAIDCEARTIRGVRISAYDSQGTLMGKTDLPADSEAAKADLRDEDGTAALANAACDGVALTGQSFASIDAFSAWVKTSPAQP